LFVCKHLFLLPGKQGIAWIWGTAQRFQVKRALPIS
jgi:hypothetical protein